MDILLLRFVRLPQKSLQAIPATEDIGWSRISGWFKFPDDFPLVGNDHDEMGDGVRAGR